VIVVVSLEGAAPTEADADAEEDEEEDGLSVGVGDTLSCISITSTFTSSLLSLGEPCLERRPGTLPSSRMRDEVNLQRPPKKERKRKRKGGSVYWGFTVGGKEGKTYETKVGNSADAASFLSGFSLTERKLSSPTADA